MCMQCIAGAASAAAGASGLRAWLVVRFGHLMTPPVKRTLTAGLLVAGVLAGGLAGPTP